jgi:hypothetical protein
MPGDDALGANSTIVLLPAWPCAYDVAFKLAAPWATTVEGVVAGGKLTSLTVTPPSRAGNVRVVNCN